MLVLTKNKGSGDRMPSCSDGGRKIYLNCAFVTFSLLFFWLQHSQLYLPSLWYISMEMYTKGIPQNRNLKYFPQFNQWQRFYRNLSVSVLNSFPSIYMSYLLFLKEKDGLLKSNGGAIIRKKQCINSKVICALFTASFSA